VFISPYNLCLVDYRQTLEASVYSVADK